MLRNLTDSDPIFSRLGSGPSGLPPKRSTAGVKLESLDNPAAFDAVDLSHLRSAVKRSPGYQEWNGCQKKLLLKQCLVGLN